MAYTIILNDGLDKDHYGYGSEYSIDFSFKQQKANVTIEVWDEEPGKVHLTSNTDGYHWLQFFLCQEPNAKELLSLPFKDEISLCKKLFSQQGMLYEQEDKETAWITINRPLNEDVVRSIADIIEPRFANRERFFPD